MSNLFKDWLTTTISSEEHAAPDLYQPLSPERVQELLDARPFPESVFDAEFARSLIKSVEHYHLTESDGKQRTVVCTITLHNGFQTHGIAVCGDARNNNRELGEHFAYQKAFAEIVPIAVYLKMQEAMLSKASASSAE
jgi:hypothetical protein